AVAPARLSGRATAGAAGMSPAPASGAQLEVLDDGGRDFLDRLVGGREPADALAPHHRLGLRDLAPAVLQRGVGAAWPAFVAHLGEPLGRDRQAEELALVGIQRVRQALALEVLRNERVVRRLDAELHREVEAGGR